VHCTCTQARTNSDARRLCAAHATCANADTKIGLPELSLGVIPGFGGTQRLPRLIGLQKALMMMLTSTPISAKEALKLGLFDAVVEPAQLLPTARQLALDMASNKAFRKVTIDCTAKLEPLAEAEAIVEFARAEAVKRAGASRALFHCCC
jgi:enoyl-CoA hydratase/3-hydroxyacyl-CoA dehydrogenase